MKVFAKGGEFELSPELVRSLASTYPAVNVRRELERMYLWTLKNESKRWDLPLRGIENWLRRASKAAIEARAKNPKVQAKETQHRYMAGERPVLVGGWMQSEEGTLEYGRQKGILPKRGESMSAYRARLKAA